MDFEFIKDEQFRNILNRDYTELVKCLEIKASKSVLVLSGSIIESILIDYFVSYPIPTQTPDKLKKMDLSGLIDLALDQG